MSLNIDNQVSRMRPLFDFIKKQQENRQFVRSVEITATFVLITFFLIFAVRPTIITIASLRGDIESKKILKSELKNKINQVIQAQDLFSQVQERYQVINSSLPDRPNFYDAADIITQISQKNSITLNSILFDLEVVPYKNEPSVKSYSLQIGVSGSFDSALNIASELLKNRRTDNISSLNFTTGLSPNQKSASPSASSGVITSFSTHFYYWPATYGKK
ncbi:MAG: hypothetical protein WAV41_00040 [Microgenomates group bacterium]